MITRRAFCAAAAAMAAENASAQTADPLARRFGAPFTLTSHSGAAVSSADFRGRLMLVYFGFTNCADTCPGDLLTIGQALEALGSKAGQAQPLFITVDPEFDTAPVMAAYLESFHKNIIGLTGTEADIAAVAKAYRVHRRLLRISPEKRSETLLHLVHGAKTYRGGQWTVDHGSLAYLMGRDGGFLTLFPSATPADRMAKVMQGYIVKADL